MEKIKELYYESAYIKEFDAVVTECSKASDGVYEVVLNQTAFFPEQGGQTSDNGILTDGAGREYRVSHVSIEDSYKEGGQKVIRHITDAPIEAGSAVHGLINWEHRFSNMQQHTGEHIFSGLVHSKYGYDNVGFHLSDCEVTMDYNGVLSQEAIAEIEMQVNRAIWENVEVTCEFPDEKRLAEIDYRSKKELSGDIRIVTVRGYDVCACCAPHVSRTGEIGLLKVTGLQSYKGGVRVSILCGKRALEYLSSQQHTVRELVNIFTTSEDNIVSSVKKLSDENAGLKAELAAAYDRLIMYEVMATDAQKENIFIHKPNSTEQNIMRRLANELAKKHSGFCGVFAGDDDTGYKYIICSGLCKRDTGELLKLLKDRLNAKGGGSAQMIQGSIQGAAFSDIQAVCEEA